MTRMSDDRAEWISLERARTNNLKDVSVRVPKHQITAFTGVSGSGKSSLAFGTIAAEATRLTAETYPLFVRSRLPSSGRADVDHIDGLMFTTVVDQRPFAGNARSTVGTASDIAPLLRMLFSRIGEPCAGYSPAYSFNDPSGMCLTCEGLGAVDDINLDQLLDTSLSLNQAARSSLIEGRSIADWSALPVSQLRRVVRSVRNSRVDPVIAAISERLQDLDAVGLGYLTLDRHSMTLSGGEAQRVKIVRHLGSALSDVCYVFDEPRAGRHPDDVHRLITLLAGLRDAHNTVLVVEHHPAVINAADHVIDLGPRAGSDGGRIQFEGTPADLAAADTATGRMLNEQIHLNLTPRTPSGSVTVEHAAVHNLMDITIDFPLKVLTVVTGVAGSGKSTLAAGALPAQHPQFAVIGQEPLRGGSRSTPATVLGIADPVRREFARSNRMAPSWFSSNAKGACPVCKGKGMITTDLAFLDDVSTPCEACDGTRFNPQALAAKLQGNTIADILAMSASQCLKVFRPVRSIARPLTWLKEVGLGYLSIGQSTNTLSGGELQQLQLAQHLSDTPEPSNLRLVLDEPTVGLHGADIDRPLLLFDRLINEGASIIVIEHNQRVVAHADYVIDIGPGAGDLGGTVIYQGPPQGLLTAEESLTGRYLRVTQSPAR